jgi:hypothetical protein
MAGIPTSLGASRLRVVGNSIKLRLIRYSHTTGPWKGATGSRTPRIKVALTSG